MASSFSDVGPAPIDAADAQSVGKDLTSFLASEGLTALMRCAEALGIAADFDPRIEDALAAIDSARKSAQWKAAQYKKLRQRVERAIDAAAGHAPAPPQLPTRRVWAMQEPPADPRRKQNDDHVAAVANDGVHAGAWVRIVGLALRTELNGVVGRLGAWDAEAGRWQLPGLGVLLRETNVQLLTAEEAAAADAQEAAEQAAAAAAAEAAMAQEAARAIDLARGVTGIHVNHEPNCKGTPWYKPRTVKGTRASAHARWGDRRPAG